MLRMLDVLARRYAFADVAALIADGACTGRRSDDQIAQIEQLCAFGARLIDLDAEDFGDPDAAANANTEHGVADRIHGDAVPAELVIRALQSRVPQTPNEPDRGALASLRPAFSLLLEVIAVRWARRETSALVAALHIAGEYLPMLAWESALGHAGDPRADERVGQRQALLWGHMENRDCPHTRPQKSAAERALRVRRARAGLARVPGPAAQRRLSGARRMCRGLPDPMLGHHPLRRTHPGAAEDRCQVAEEFADSAVIRLRHSAPVGHGFGVPSLPEVAAAWEHSRDQLARKEPRVRIDGRLSR